MEWYWKKNIWCTLFDVIVNNQQWKYAWIFFLCSSASIETNEKNTRILSLESIPNNRNSNCNVQCIALNTHQKQPINLSTFVRFPSVDKESAIYFNSYIFYSVQWPYTINRIEHWRSLLPPTTNAQTSISEPIGFGVRAQYKNDAVNHAYNQMSWIECGRYA